MYEKLLKRTNEIMKDEFECDEIRSRQVKSALQAVAELLEQIVADINHLSDKAQS